MCSVVTQHGDELGLLLAGVSRQTEFLGPLPQVLGVPVVVRGGLAALTAHLPATAVRAGVRDPSRLLLGSTLVADRLVHLVVLDAWAGLLLSRHDFSFLRSIGQSRSASQPGTAELLGRG